MSSESICKIVRQYNRFPISKEDMRKLQGIAADYSKVKNYVYARYGGIGCLSKLYPGYTIQNEMTKSGLRAELGLPSVYFYLAMFDALGDIKGQWSQIQAQISELVNRRETFSPEEKHYLRFLLKVSNAFESVLNQRTAKFPEKIQKQYEELTEAVDVRKLNNYLSRQVRKRLVRLHTEVSNSFSVSGQAYRYGSENGYPGIYLAAKEKRKRLFIPLTDNNQYDSQLYIKLKPEEMGLEIHVPITVTARRHEDYVNSVGLSLGVFKMLTTDSGHVYGEKLGDYQTEYAEWIREQTASYQRNRTANPGRKKYEAQKRRRLAGLHDYINQELNRFLRTEKPKAVYLAKLPQSRSGRGIPEINNGITLWQKGYIRERLMQKCKEQSIEFREIFGKDTSRMCSECGGIGRKEEGTFFCAACGYQAEEKTNTARNVLKRGLEGKRRAEPVGGQTFVESIV